MYIFLDKNYACKNANASFLIICRASFHQEEFCSTYKKRKYE